MTESEPLFSDSLYAELARTHPNFVGTKNDTNSIGRLRGMMTRSPQLQHFPLRLLPPYVGATDAGF